MILGSCMDRLSWPGRAGIRTPGSTFRDQVWFLALASSRLCLAALVGDGITGDLTGSTAISFTTTTATFPTAESSPIATTSIADAQASIMPAGFVVEADFRAEARAGVGVSVELPSRMDLWRRTPSLVPIPAHSAASTMEEPPEDFRLAGDRASAEDSTEAEATGNSDPLLQSQLTIGRELMRTRNMNMNMKVGTFRHRLASMVALAVLPLLVVGSARSSLAQTSKPKTFSSPGEAANALFQAVQREDEQTLEAIFGAGTEVTSSKDEVEDKLERERFSQKYQEMHRLVREPDGSTVLYIGAENWPFPISLVSKNGAWFFDSDTGTKEILFRRIGENEVTAIQVCNAVAMAKKRGQTNAAGDDPIDQYAQSLVTA